MCESSSTVFSRWRSPAGLSNLNPEVEYRFKSLGDTGFTAAIYVSGEKRTSCRVDELDVHEEKDTLQQQLTRFRARLSEDFGSRVEELTFWDTAARDPDGRVPLAHGVDRLFTDWVTPRPPARTPIRSHPRLSTEFDSLLSRTPIGGG